MLILWPIPQIEMDHSQYPGIMALSALLREHGIRSELVAADLHAVFERLDGSERIVLAFSSPTAHAARLLDLSRRIKKHSPEVFTVFGGPHPTYFPEMIEEGGVDAVCLGEGEFAMLELATALDTGGDHTSIRNLWVKHDGAIHRNPIRPLIGDLDSLPIPDHGLFLRAAGKPPLQAIVMTGRGCPYSCTYCYNNAYKKLYAGKGRVVRRRSVAHVMRELLILKEAGCRYIRFMDDVFTVSEDWVREFSETYASEIGLPFSCLVRANLITSQMARWLKKAGCHRILMGIEAGNDRLREEVFKRKMTRNQILDAARMIREAGLKLVTANILAVAGGSLEADWETVDLNLEARPHFASASLLQAFPGTEIHHMATDLGLLQEDNLAQLSQGGFGFATALRHPDESEARQMVNLHKFFPLVIWFPWLRPVVRRLIKFPPNALFEILYMISFNIGSLLIAMPPKVGLVVLWRKVRRWFSTDRWRRARRGVLET